MEYFAYLLMAPMIILGVIFIAIMMAFIPYMLYDIIKDSIMFIKNLHKWYKVLLMFIIMYFLGFAILIYSHHPTFFPTSPSP